ncbi:hypothetical protein [Sorangium cellulosum]|uniref:hypothetical protein n=1 Tax=Sorangium cellulosum TaxID=56 RepID=UPI000CF45970|nr:hypothetical protein [Sorangium cellulosum]
MNPERAEATSETEHQGGPKPVPYTYHDGREDYLHVGRQEGAPDDQPEAIVPRFDATPTPAPEAALPPEATALPPEATAMPPGVTPEAAEAARSPATPTALPPEATALPPEAAPLPPEAPPRAAAQPPREAARMREIVTRGLRTGAVMTAATMCTMMAASTLKRGSPWASMNAMATAVGLGGRRASDRFDPVVTPAGIAVLAGGLLVWGIGYEKALDATRQRSSALTGALSAVGGFLLDELVLPDRLMKNFRDKMGVLGTLSKYVALGVASAAAPR